MPNRPHTEAPPTFTLARWGAIDQRDAFAEWQAHVDAGRIGVRPDHDATNAAVDAAERAVLGPQR